MPTVSAARRPSPDAAPERLPAAGEPPSPPGGPERPAIASFAALRALLREDYTTNQREFWAPGFQALLAYRLGVWCNGLENRVLRVPARLLHRFLSLIARNLYGIQLSTHTHIGRRLRIAHQHGIVISGAAVIGDDCLIRHGVTIGLLGGARAGRAATGAPRLGDRVEVGVGAVLVGPIRIGDDALIGPNAVVMTHVPAGAIVASPQSRIVAPPPRREAPRK
jgi:serine O-acetyltransferase